MLITAPSRLLWCHVRLLLAPLLHPRRPAQLHEPILCPRSHPARHVLRPDGRQGGALERKSRVDGPGTRFARRSRTFTANSNSMHHYAMAVTRYTNHHPRNRYPLASRPQPPPSPSAYAPPSTTSSSPSSSSAASLASHASTSPSPCCPKTPRANQSTLRARPFRHRLVWPA